jgi:hypothetical protein
MAPHSDSFLKLYMQTANFLTFQPPIDLLFDSLLIISIHEKSKAINLLVADL